MIYARGSNPAGFFILSENSQKDAIKVPPEGGRKERNAVALIPFKPITIRKITQSNNFVKKALTLSLFGGNIKSPNGDDKNQKGDWGMNLRRLKGEIVAVYGTQAAFADHVSWHKNKVSRLVTGQYKPDMDDVDVIVSALDLTPDKFLEIFMPTKSLNGDNSKSA